MGWSSLPKVPKVTSLECLHNLPKKVEVDFLHSDKHQILLQGDTIMYVLDKGCSKYSRQQVCIISTISQKRGYGWSSFFARR